MRRNPVVMFLMVLTVLILLVAPLAAAPAMKDWTWMVFLNADNNLDQFGVEDQEEMARSGSHADLNVVTLIDRRKGPATLNFIAKNQVIPLENMGELDMGDYRVLTAFVRKVAAAYPARHYALVVWNHGSGWKNEPRDGPRGISYDDQSGNHITTEQLALAMSEIRGDLGRPLDLLAFDACLMQMVEVLWAVRHDCEYVVGSEQTVPGDGYPYEEVLGGVRPGMSSAEVCRHLVRAFAASYAGGSQGNSDITLSAVECARLEGLRTAVDGLARALMAKDFGILQKEALDQATHYTVYEYVDLGQLIDLLAAKIDDPAVGESAGACKAALQAAVLANGVHGDMAGSQGLSIFFPPIHWGFPAKYAKLAWAQDSQWDEMLADFYRKTSTGEVLAALERGDPSRLADFVRRSGPEDRDIRRHLVGRVNFAAFAEAGMPSSLQATVRNLLQELIVK